MRLPWENLFNFGFVFCRWGTMLRMLSYPLLCDIPKKVRVNMLFFTFYFSSVADAVYFFSTKRDYCIIKIVNTFGIFLINAIFQHSRF